MTRALRFIFFVTMIAGLFSCRSEFEKARTSSDAELIYKKATEYYDEGEWLKAQSLYELVLNNFKASDRGEEIYFKYAMTFYNMDQFISAAYHFQTFSKRFPSSEKREELEFMEAYSHYLLSPIYRLDQTYSHQAIAEFQDFVNAYPRSGKVDQCNELIDEMRAKLEKKSFEQGRLYFEMRQYAAAVQTFENLLIDFPESNSAEEVNWLIVESNFLFADNSVYEKKKERFEKTLESANYFLRKFPDSAHAQEAQNYISLANANISKIKS